MAARVDAVLIIGGGPAGLATALELRRRQVAAVVIERSAYDDRRIGEHLTPQGLLDLKALDPTPLDQAGVHAESAGVTAYWGAEIANYTDYFLHPGQRGLNLSRPRFDADLARAAESSGATILRLSSLKRASRNNAVWQVDVDHNGSTIQVAASFVVDATGRSAAFSCRQGARICAHDWQVAIAALQDGADDAHPDTRSIVEAVESGWWYFAPISAGRSICMFVTDSDLLPRGAKQELCAWWRDQLSQTVHMSRRFRSLVHSGDLFIRSARSQCLDVPIGSGWLAVGDAAMAFDPLASQGIIKALDHGKRAAASIYALLKGDDLSLDRFALHVRNEYAAFLAMKAQYYRLEQRWPQSKFWQRRTTIAKSPIIREIADDV